MSQPSTVKLLIVTDSPATLRANDPALASAADIEVVAEAQPGDDVTTMTSVYQPDVVIMDYDLPGFNAADTARAILHAEPTTQIIMLSLVSDANDIRHAMRAGARDYLIKPLHEGELVETIRWLIKERREYAKTRAFIGRMRKAFETLFYDDKPVPDNVVRLLEGEVVKKPDDRLALETLAVAYARNRDWKKLAPLVAKLAHTQLET
jgi:DNA-binding NarL/FixJ family response regulator